MFSSVSHAEIFRGYGIEFEYPNQYQVTTEENKGGKRIKLRQGTNSIQITIKPNRFKLSFAESLAESILQVLKKNYQITDILADKKKIPLKVKGKAEEIEVDTLKYSYTLTHTKGKLNIILYQTLYLFSYGRSGYIIEFTRVTEDYSDMIKVLSSFHFDEAEKPIVTESESRY